MVRVVSGGANIEVGIWNFRIGISHTVFYIFSRKDAAPMSRDAKFASIGLTFDFMTLQLSTKKATHWIAFLYVVCGVFSTSLRGNGFGLGKSLNQMLGCNVSP